MERVLISLPHLYRKKRGINVARGAIFFQLFCKPSVINTCLLSVFVLRSRLGNRKRTLCTCSHHPGTCPLPSCELLVVLGIPFRQPCVPVRVILLTFGCNLDAYLIKDVSNGFLCLPHFLGNLLVAQAVHFQLGCPTLVTLKRFRY